MKRSLLFSSLLALLLTGCGGSTAVKVGVIAPLTGDFASGGADTLNGARLAVDRFNASGGIAGRPVELIAEDGRCTGADALSAAQKLVNVDRVDAIVGGVCSSETLAAAPIAAAAKIVILSPTSSSPKITGFSPHLFRNYPSDGLKGKAFGAYFRKAGFTKIAILSENTDFCQGIRGGVKDNVPAGAQIVFDEVVEPGTKDYRTLLTRLKGMDVDLVVTNGQSDTTIAEMIKQMRALDLKQQIIGADVMDSVTLGQLVGAPIDGTLALSAPSLDEAGGEGSAFARAFRSRFGEPKFGMYFAASAFDAMNLTLKTLADAGGGDRQREAFLKLKEYPGVIGTFRFDANGDVVGIPFGLKQFQGGKPVQTEVIPVD